VGYGDVSPETSAGKISFIVFILVGLSLVGFCLGVMVSTFSDADEREPSAFEKTCCGFLDQTIGSTARIVAVNVLVLVLLGAIGTVYLIIVEEFTTMDAIYWSVTTFTTVGYGDLSLSEKHGTRWFFIVYIIISVTVAGSTIAGFATIWVQYEQHSALQAVVDKGVTEQMIQAMDIDGDNAIHRDEFLGYMLIKLQVVDAETLDSLFDLFDQFDVDGSGVLSHESVVAFQKLHGK